MMSHKYNIPVDSQHVGVLWDSKQVQDKCIISITEKTGALTSPRSHTFREKQNFL